jgi:3-dehydroquinate dehydratase-2
MRRGHKTSARSIDESLMGNFCLTGDMRSRGQSLVVWAGTLSDHGGARRASALGVEIEIFYTNTEGEAVSAIYKADRAKFDGLLFNPAGFLHAGHALRDCLRSISMPAIEIHMTNIEKRGFGSITAEAAVGMIAGFGVDSYLLALEAIVARARATAA